MTTTKQIQKYFVYKNGVQVKKKIISTNKGNPMISIWKKFNDFANKQGATIQIVDEKYLGIVAWKNENEDLYELRKIDD